MLKWTASAQKLPQDTPVSSHTNRSTATLTTNNMRTPRLTEAKRRKRRATIANKENIPILTSTPMVSRTRNSPLVLAPLADILNVTPEAVANRTPERRRVSVNVFNDTNASTIRRHSSVGFTIPQIPQYAATLPKYEEEYSPSTILPTGQQLALRGLLPDPFMGNPRYFTTPELNSKQESEIKKISSLPKKRKLEQEFVAIAKEEEGDIMEHSAVKAHNKKDLNNTGLMSNKMGDQTLDHLIDAILDSARKEEKKKKPRKSFNLRRRTLLKNQVEQHQDIMLSPSYAAGDDPCSDLSFLNCEPLSYKKPFRAVTPQPASPIPKTPQPATPLATTPLLNQQQLLAMPTPAAAKRNDSFSLDTPVRSNLKRRSESNARENASAKKYKVDSRNYFEIGVALPSIYV
ncbi:uncharacterized protein LOC111679318 [Lucilia cuprina]|uniref:uncharacterized protein LOC111679318 n=1 Tax=Lucilia cuprina TaxID=7375 RepID=UPI001F06B62F|nr:uncharacterized protein LOC111679318 [Lucilia cuprina]